jgi:hypothetical protein
MALSSRRIRVCPVKTEIGERLGSDCCHCGTSGDFDVSHEGEHEAAVARRKAATQSSGNRRR